MTRIHKSATAAIVGLTALALLAGPSFAGGNHGTMNTGAPVQSGQGYGPGMMGRGQLRSDVDGKIVNEEFVLPAVHRRFR